uniref:Uncharacterized protein n=1 Tax=Rhizophora mucronata TaxID=61149 RepID=A0A2P2QYU8_RHIMU
MQSASCSFQCFQSACDVPEQYLASFHDCKSHASSHTLFLLLYLLIFV